MATYNGSTISSKDDHSYSYDLTDKEIEALLVEISDELKLVNRSTFSLEFVNGLMKIKANLVNEQYKRKCAAWKWEIDKWFYESLEKYIMVQDWIDTLEPPPPTKLPLLMRGRARNTANSRKPEQTKPTDDFEKGPDTPGATKSKIPVLNTRKYRN